MKKLADIYRDIEPNCTKLYVIPHIGRTKKTNSYLELLYTEFNKTDSPIRMESLLMVQYPLLVLRRLAGEKSILHQHWLDFSDFMSGIKYLWKFLWVLLFKAVGGKVVWTVHNIYPHKAQYINKRIFNLNAVGRRLMARVADRLHVHTETGARIMTEVLGCNPEKFFVIPHPYYPAETIAKEEALAYLAKNYKVNFTTNDIILLNFGFIAPYKGILELIQAFNTIRKPSPLKLLIVGREDGSFNNYMNNIHDAMGNNESIQLIPLRIPEDELKFFYNAIDYGVFNYQSILTSGGVILALSYKKKVIIPNMGDLKELSPSENILKFDANTSLITVLNKLA